MTKWHFLISSGLPNGFTAGWSRDPLSDRLRYLTALSTFGGGRELPHSSQAAGRSRGERATPATAHCTAQTARTPDLASRAGRRHIWSARGRCRAVRGRDTAAGRLRTQDQRSRARWARSGAAPQRPGEPHIGLARSPQRSPATLPERRSNSWLLPGCLFPYLGLRRFAAKTKVN